MILVARAHINEYDENVDELFISTIGKPTIQYYKKK